MSESSGLRLRLVRVLWVIVAGMVVVVMAAGVPYQVGKSSVVCAGTVRECLEVFRLTPEALGGLSEFGVSLEAWALVRVGLDLFIRLAWFVVGVAIFLRRSDDVMALIVSGFLITFGTMTFGADGVDTLTAVNPAWSIPARSLQIIGEIGAVLFFLTFPSGRFVPRWTVLLAAVFLAFQIPTYFSSEPYYRAYLPEEVQGAVFLVLVLSLVVSQVYRYLRVSDFRERRQTKTVVLGTVAAIVLLAGFVAPLWLVSGLIERSSPLVIALIGSAGSLVMLPIPVSIGIAVLRSGLFDIDVVINRALVYGALTISLAGTYLASVVSLQYVFRAITGSDSQLAVVASTLAIAAMFVPLRRRLQHFIDRRFYRSKYDARQTLEAFSMRLRDETKLETLSRDLISVTRSTVQPTHASLWLRDSDENPRKGNPDD